MFTDDLREEGFPGVAPNRTCAVLVRRMSGEATDTSWWIACQSCATTWRCYWQNA